MALQALAEAEAEAEAETETGVERGRRSIIKP